MFGFLARDHEIGDVGLAIETSQPLSVDEMESVARIFPVQGIVDDAVLVCAIYADIGRLIVDRMIVGLESSGIALECMISGNPENECNQRHADRDPEGGLAEIRCAAIAVQGDVELPDTGQWMEEAGLGEFLVLQETLVDGGIVLALVGPAFFLGARDIHRVDVLADLDFYIGDEGELMRLFGGHIKSIDAGPVLFLSLAPDRVAKG